MAGIQDVLDKLNDVLEKIADNRDKIAEVKVAVEAKKNVQQICWHCGGDGQKLQIGGSFISCPDCNGSGVKPFGRITD